MNKSDAIKLMKLGIRITHRSFSDDEWMIQVGNIIILEDGVQVFSSEFWKYRPGDNWDDGYSLFNIESIKSLKIEYNEL